jgi:PAS domain-containing protein
MTFGIKHLLLPGSIIGIIFGSSPASRSFPIPPDSWNLKAETGKIVVETTYKAPAESITSTAPLYVSGFEAGSVRAKRSVRNILWGTVFAGIVGSVFGLVINLFFKSYPLRLLNEALTRLSAEKEKTETTLSSIGDGVMAVDREGRIAYMNPVAEKCTGWRSDEVFGHDFKDCYVTRGPDFPHPPFSPRRPACVRVSSGFPSHGGYTDGQRPPEAATGGVACREG